MYPNDLSLAACLPADAPGSTDPANSPSCFGDIGDLTIWSACSTCCSTSHRAPI